MKASVKYLATPKSACMINSDLESFEVKADAKESIQIATLLGSTSAAAMPVRDLATQCPGDKWSLTCEPMDDTYLLYNDKTGKADVNAPSQDKTIIHDCKVLKTASNGEQEKKEFKITILPVGKVPHPVCKIDTSKIPKTM